MIAPKMVLKESNIGMSQMVTSIYYYLPHVCLHNYCVTAYYVPNSMSVPKSPEKTFTTIVIFGQISRGPMDLFFGTWLTFRICWD